MSEMMSVWELVLWSGMSGAIGLLCLTAVADWVFQRTAAALRGLAFIVLTGSAAVWMSGLPEAVFPGLDPQMALVFKSVLGPLAGALALSYLGIWMDAGRDDPLTRWVVVLGSAFLVVSAAWLGWAAVLGSAVAASDLFLISGMASLIAVLLAGFVSVRAAVLGDALARWMVQACACLALMVTGLYAKGLALPGTGLWTWLLTAMATVAFFMIVVVLTIQRNREVRRLRRLSKGLAMQELDIPMPQGSQLIPRVADALWRSHRLERPCVVAAIAVRNLYELGEHLGHGAEAQILAVLAARIRRHVGFRNVVGLYHPRCFVLAVSPGQDPRRGELLAETLLRTLRLSVRVGSADHRIDFWPEVGMGVVTMALGHPVNHPTKDALSAINRAEHMALEDRAVDALTSRTMEFDSFFDPL